MMGRRRGFLPPALCQHCGKAPDLGRHLWPGEIWRCLACLEVHLPGKDALSKSMHQMLDYAQGMKEVFDLEETGSKAQEPRSRAEWARMMAVEIQKQGMARVKERPQINGEVLPSPDEKLLHDTMADPNLATVEAALERNRLLLEHGTNVAAMALDASATINAGNSIERMLTHQLAVAHKNAMQQISRAHSAYDLATEMKRYTLSVQFMKIFQQGMLTLKKLRQGGQQKITVQYVNVSHGSQAVVGNVEGRNT